MFIRKRILRVARFVAAVSVIASLIGLLTTGGCGKGIFPEVTATAVTITPTPAANAFLYATNFNDGTVSAFARNTNTGALSFISKTTAGSSGGPEGIAVANNNFVYVANASDGNVYPFQIQSSGSGTPGDLTALTRAASGVTPQMVAVDKTNSFVYVTNAGSKTVSEFSINSDGTLTSLGVVPGFGGKPFGITINPNGGFLYVADATAGLLYSYAIGSTGVLTQIGTAVPSNGSSPGQPGLMASVFDGTQGYLFVDDTALNVVSIFLIQSNGSLGFSGVTVGQNQSTPIGIGAFNSGGGTSTNYVFTANKGGNFVLPFVRTNGTTLTAGSAIAVSGAPTGLIIDSAGLFVYTGNSGNGTIAQIGITNSQCSGGGTCLIKTYNSESPANSSAGTQFLATTTP